MAKNNQNGFNEKVEDYSRKISKLLDIEDATAQEVKDALTSIEKFMKLINNEKRDDRVKTHQVRTIFSLIKNGKSEKELNLIIPRLKYIGARQKGKSGRFIVDLLEALIDEINKSDKDKETLIKGLIYIMESIVAYHKFYVKE